jgi:hypothetical protein
MFCLFLFLFVQKRFIFRRTNIAGRCLLFFLLGSFSFPFSSSLLCFIESIMTILLGLEFSVSRPLPPTPLCTDDDAVYQSRREETTLTSW